MVQYIVSVGQQQYDRGSYIEAQKTLLKAQEYAQHLDPIEQRRLESLLARAGKAATERKRIEEARLAADELSRKGDILAARARIESVKDSEFLTAKERQEITNLLRGASPSPVPVVASVTAPVPSDTASPVSGPVVATRADAPKEVPPVAGDALERYKSSIAETYYKSMAAYQTRDLTAAKEGFTRVLQSGLMPVAMADSIRGYLADIEAAQTGGVRRPVALADVSAQAMPEIGALTPANAPANLRAQNTSAGQGERERIQNLYNRSRELYIQGELAAARQGFEEVARSGLISAPPGLRPEDYVAQINEQLASQAAPSLSPQAAPVIPMVLVPTREPGVTPLSAQPAAGEGGFVEEINRRRNTIRSYAENIVNDSIEQAQKFMAQGDFASARDRVENAIRVVNEYQLYLGDELYKQHTQRLNGTSDRIREAQAEKDKQLAEQKRQEAADAQRQYRTQAEQDRQRRIDELMERAKAYWKQQQFEAAQGQLDALLHIDPLNDEALTLKDMVEDMIYFRKQIEQQKLDRRQTADIKLSTDEATIPYADEITYPKNWREIAEKRKPEAPFQLDPANAQTYEQLEQTVDLSAITQQTPASEVFEILRNSVQPPLNLVVLWRDLYENATIEPSSAVQFDGPASVRLGTALENVCSALTDPLATSDDYRVDYVVNKGVVTVATRIGLPRKKLETRVYDVSDLVNPPSTGMGMMGGMGMGMGGMGSYGGGMGGMGGMSGMGGMGGMGGYGGGGMMGGSMGGMGMGGMSGMGGYGGGMGGMGGMGGGMGGMGGGMGGYGGGMSGGMGGMGGMGGGMMGGMGGMGGMMGGMGMGGGMSSYQSMSMAYGLRDMIEQSIEPDSWYDLSETGEGTITIYPQESPKKLAISTTPEVHQQIEKLLDELRKALGHQVSIEARFLSVTENFLDDIGLDLDFSYNFGGKFGVATFNQGSSVVSAPSVGTGIAGNLGNITSENPGMSIAGGYGSILDDLQVAFLLRATQARQDSKALAAPKVTVISGEPASFSLYDQVSYALPPTETQGYVTSSSGTTTGTTQGTYQNVYSTYVGSYLYITPTITKDKKYVLLNIQTQQTDLLGFARHAIEQQNDDTDTGDTADENDVTVTHVQVPETETSTVTTRVSVPDRGTLLLGGHKLAQQVAKETGVPVLSKIPILGPLLFSNRSMVRDQKVLLILVKPTIILQEEAEQEAIAAMEEPILNSLRR